MFNAYVYEIENLVSNTLYEPVIPYKDWLSVHTKFNSCTFSLASPYATVCLDLASIQESRWWLGFSVCWIYA